MEKHPNCAALDMLNPPRAWHEARGKSPDRLVPDPGSHNLLQWVTFPRRTPQVQPNSIMNIEARVVASGRKIRALRGGTIPQMAELANEPEIDFVPLVEREGVEYLAYGAAADIWKVSETGPLPTAEPDSTPIHKNFVHKVLRVGSLGREWAVSDQKIYIDLWRDFTKDYRSKVNQWKILKHDNLVQVLGLGDGLNLKVELCERGSVREYLKRKPVTNPPKTDIIVDILSGLHYMHSQAQPVVHGSLNAGKVFLDANGRAKIGEFGLALLCYPIAPFVPAVSLAGPSRWLSPELLEDDTVVKPTTASDIWALGCVLFEVIAERIPYSDSKSDISAQRCIIGGESPGQLDENFEHQPFSDLRSLLAACWKMNPKERPSSLQALQHTASAIQASKSMIGS